MYKTVVDEVLDSLGGLAAVKAPVEEYIDALEYAKEQVEAWFEASLDAAKDALRRQNGG